MRLWPLKSYLTHSRQFARDIYGTIKFKVGVKIILRKATLYTYVFYIVNYNTILKNLNYKYTFVIGDINYKNHHISLFL